MEESVSIGGRTITNLPFAGDIDFLGGKKRRVIQVSQPTEHAINNIRAWRSVQKRLS